MELTSYNKPWIEKYRPNNLINIKGQEQVIDTLKKMVDNGNLPNLIFHGPAGTGKTSLVISLANYIYQDKINLMTLELNASDDRGIDIVREEIKDFAEKQNLFHSGIKLVILDEVDSMTLEAQYALRYIMEKFSKDTRFCLICNYFHKIIEPIKSRCCVFRFLPLSFSETKEIIKRITKEEEIKISENVIKIIYKISNGDVRKAINLLQSISLKGKKISEELILSISGNPSNNAFNEIIKTLLDDEISYKESFRIIKKYLDEEGFSLSNLINQIGNYLLENNLYLDKLKNLSDLEFKVNKSTFSIIYLYGLISFFKFKT
jgi:replication factor C subunit 3/5